MRQLTPQERFWAGEGGDTWFASADNISAQATRRLFETILSHTGPPDSIMEFGAGLGANLAALRELAPTARLTALEVNPGAATRLRQQEELTVIEASILDAPDIAPHDLVFTRALLGHVAPECLPAAYAALHAATGRCLCLIEYYNRTPVWVPDPLGGMRLMKRDFAGEILDTYPDLGLAACGFCYHRDPVAPLEDLCWFLLVRRASQ